MFKQVLISDLTKNYLCSNTIPCIGVRATVPEYKRRSKNHLKMILTLLVKAFAKKYKDYKFVLAMSGGIDSEVTAQTFYQLKHSISSALIQRLFDGINDHDIVFAIKYCKERNIPFKDCRICLMINC